MPRIRKIPKHPPRTRRNYFLVDASFLVEKYLPVLGGATGIRTRHCHRWWREIDRQVRRRRARVYIPTVCIAEAFKVLAKKYYQEKVFTTALELKNARDRLGKDITLTHKALKKQTRYIGYHDLPAEREVIVAVDRFYELFMKHRHNVGIIDLILLASAKYMMDFYDAARSQLHIVTLDEALWKGSKKVTELPNAYDPTKPADEFYRVFS